MQSCSLFKMSRKGRERKLGLSARLRFSITAFLRAGFVNGHRSPSYLTPRSWSHSFPPPKVLFSPTRSFGSSLRWVFCPPRTNRIGKPNHLLEGASLRLTTRSAPGFSHARILSLRDQVCSLLRAGREVELHVSPAAPLWGQRQAVI